MSNKKVAQYDVVIGLGCDLSPDGQSASPYGRSIASKVVELAEDYGVKDILFIGGYTYNDGPSEASSMREVAKVIYPKANYFLETKSRHTYESVINSKAILKKHKWKKILVVAQQKHSWRVKLLFKKQLGAKYSINVVKAYSKYGGGSQTRLDNVIFFWMWDTAALIYSKLKGWI